MKRFIALKNDIVVHFKDTGLADSSALVFIHGNGGSLEVWEGVTRSALLKNYRKIALDLPGFGKSPHIFPVTQETYSLKNFGTTVSELLETLAIKDYILVGHSLGSNIILQSIGLFTGAKGIFLTSVAPVPSVSSVAEAYNFTKEIGVIYNESISEEEIDSLAKAFLATESKELVDKIKGWLILSDKHARMGIVADIPNIKDEWEAIMNLPFPVALAVGGLDIGINHDYLRNTLPKDNLWNKKVNVVPGAGHYLPLEKPEILADLINVYISHLL